ncbi:hypothetical protein CDAR_433141 [Caerostris darwini]|uniref:Uncharacterized protein n=1 Tax=Caerostris darwini TaxID=1538125 RepID=A0AAV4QFW6_9ARAC|nr:hypothetical protein CDAR_433141 [Caerostris darwini]
MVKLVSDHERHKSQGFSGDDRHQGPWGMLGASMEGFSGPDTSREKADALKREKIFLGAEKGGRKASPAVPDAIGWINHPALFPETSGNGPPSNKNNGPHVSIATITESIPPPTEKWFKEFPSTKTFAELSWVLRTSPS